jgi:Flp pilus assembly protein TadG
VINCIFRRITSDESGVALVEFVLVLPILLLLLFGMVDFGKMFNYWIDETHLANEAARYAVVNRNPSTSGQTLQAWIQQQADTNELRGGGTDSIPTPAQVCISFPNGTATVGDPVQVTVSTDYHFLPFVGAKIKLVSNSISGSSIMRLEAPPTNYAAGCS